MKRLWIFSVVIAAAVACILVNLWTRPSHKDLTVHAAFRDTAASFSTLLGCIDEYGLNEPQQAMEILTKTNIDLADMALQKRLGPYLRSYNSGIDLFHDGWGEVIHIRVLQVTTNRAEGKVEARIVIWSNGKNRINEDGKGDDMVFGPFVTEMLIPNGGER